LNEVLLGVNHTDRGAVSDSPYACYPLRRLQQPLVEPIRRVHVGCADDDFRYAPNTERPSSASCQLVTEARPPLLRVHIHRVVLAEKHVKRRGRRAVSIGELAQGNVREGGGSSAVRPGGDEWTRFTVLNASSLQLGQALIKGHGLECESDEMRRPGVAALPREPDCFDYDVAKPNTPAGHPATIREGPSDRQLQGLDEERIQLVRLVRPNHDVIDVLNHGLNSLLRVSRGAADATAEKGRSERDGHAL
jgi:hypothetical protein